MGLSGAVGQQGRKHGRWQSIVREDRDKAMVTLVSHSQARGEEQASHCSPEQTPREQATPREETSMQKERRKRREKTETGVNKGRASLNT